MGRRGTLVPASEDAREKSKKAFLYASTTAVIIATTVFVAFDRFSIVLQIILFQLVYLPVSSGNKTLLWLRRFHKKTPGEFPYSSTLISACKGLCTAVTLQDSSFHHSWEAGNSRLIALMPIVVTIGVPSLLIVSAIIAGVLSETEISMSIFFTVFFIGSFIVFFGLLRTARQYGYRKLNNTDFVSTINGLFDRQKGFRRSVGAIVLQSEDSFWRDAVLRCLDQSDAVLIDISEVTENIRWELRNAFNVKTSNAVMLSCKTTKNRQPFNQCKAALSLLRQSQTQRFPSSLEILTYCDCDNREKSISNFQIRLRSRLKRCFFPITENNITSVPKHIEKLARRDRMWPIYLYFFLTMAISLEIFFAISVEQYHGLIQASEVLSNIAMYVSLSLTPICTWLWWRSSPTSGTVVSSAESSNTGKKIIEIVTKSSNRIHVHVDEDKIEGFDIAVSDKVLIYGKRKENLIIARKVLNSGTKGNNGEHNSTL